MSWDGKTIVYEYDSGLWKLDVPTGQASEISFDLPVDQPSNDNVWMTLRNNIDDFSTSTTAQDLAFSVRGEIFSLPVTGGDTTRITASEARDQLPAYSPNGKKLAYISDKDGDEKIYIYDTEKKETQVVEPVGNIHYNIMWTWGGVLVWSPDGKKLIYGADSKLCIYDLDEKDTVAENRWRQRHHHPAQLVARRKMDRHTLGAILSSSSTSTSRILIPESNMLSPTSLPATSRPPFTSDGKGLLFSSERSGKYQVHYIPFEKRTYDPSDPEERKMEAGEKEKGRRSQENR